MARKRRSDFIVAVDGLDLFNFWLVNVTSGGRAMRGKSVHQFLIASCIKDGHLQFPSLNLLCHELV